MASKIFIRTRQFFFSGAMIFVKQKEPEIFSSLEDFPKKLSELKLDTILVLTTQGFIKRKTLEPFFEKLKENNITYTVYHDVEHDPTIETIEKTVAAYKENHCQAIIGIGGGSVLDCSKIAAARLTSKKTIPQMKGVLKIGKKLPPLFLAPTTAGTGSEVTLCAVVTDTVDGRHYKYAISDPCLIPSYITLDPKLLITLPPYLTATTGMDALTHAVEAYTNKFASAKVKKYGKEAVRLIFACLEKSYNRPDDASLRKQMLKASYYAGIAFSHNFVGYVHAISHATGALYGLAHGELNAKFLPIVLEQYGKSVYRTLAELSDVVGITGKDDKEKTEKFILQIKLMNKNMGISDTITELDRKDFPIIIERALAEANPLYPVPEIWNKDKIETVLEKLARPEL